MQAGTRKIEELPRQKFVEPHASRTQSHNNQGRLALRRNEMKTATRIKLNQLGIIILAWLVIGLIIAIYDHLVLHTGSALGPAPDYSFGIAVLRNMGPGFIGALLGGSMLVFYVNDRFQDKPYAYTLLVVSGVFLFIVMLVALVMGITLVPLKTGLPLSHPVSREAFRAFITDTYPIKNGLAWAIVVGITQLMLQINSKFGHRTFWNIIRGKYNTPKEEQRIFMFLDLDHSTSIAEKLGNEAYHRLLKDFFADITEPIIENKGNIYQYVGDEVVVAWDYREGLESAHCLHCFFDIKWAISKKRELYVQRYGLVPTFKAGIHSGKVVAGEVGIVKRDITYSGDVLNTTSRILGKCSELREECIISGELFNLLSNPAGFHSKMLGSIFLRGKQHEILIRSLYESGLTASSP